MFEKPYLSLDEVAQRWNVSVSDLLQVCRQAKEKARVTLESVEFPELTPIETLWLKAWKQFSRGLG